MLRSGNNPVMRTPTDQIQDSNITNYLKEPGLLRDKADSRPGAGNYAKSILLPWKARKSSKFKGT